MAGTSMVRTTNVSIRMPTATAKPSSISPLISPAIMARKRPGQDHTGRRDDRARGRDGDVHALANPMIADFFLHASDQKML
ncbi:MAG: hypothetical protein M5U29_03150 [Anaerolineae bacterium]|nr:hypothetical protein [Anaerolineae bacterium]